MKNVANRSPDAPGHSYVAAAAALLVLVVGFCGIAVDRYVSTRDAQRDGLQATETSARDLAASLVSAEGLAEIDQGLFARFVEQGRVTLVKAGSTDDFGISRGAQVAADVSLGATSLAARGAERWHKRALDRSAELESEVESGRIPSQALTRTVITSEQGPPIGVAFIPLVSNTTYLGAVVVARVLAAPDDLASPWMALVAALIGGALIWIISPRLGSRRRLRVVGAAVVGALSACCAGGAVAGLWPALALFGTALSALSLPAFATLLQGIRQAPGTYGYVAPAVVALAVLVFVPFVMGVAIAFFDKAGDFVGLDHFSEVLVPSDTAQTDFWQTFAMTVLWTVSNVVLHVAIGVALALVLNRPDLRFKGLYRVLLILPWAVPNYITALIWRGMFDSTNGAVNALLGALGVDGVTWLGDGGTVASNFIANLTTNVWLGFPFMMVVTLGALQSIPSSLYEAAEIDGATRAQRFRFVTMPLLKPALVPAIVLGTIWTFNMFNVIYLVSRGAPGGKTEIMITEAYKAFWILERPGLAAAYALMIFVVLLAYGVITDRITRASSGAFE